MDGGWKTLELQRAHFVTGRLHDNMREFLITGINTCISVLSQEEPRIETASMLLHRKSDTVGP